MDLGDRTDVNPSKGNLFRSGDIVRFRPGMGRDHSATFEVHHVERNMVYLISTAPNGNTKIVDYDSYYFQFADKLIA